VGVLNIGSYGGSDSAGSIVAPKIGFNSGTGYLNFNQTNTFTLTNEITGGNALSLSGGMKSHPIPLPRDKAAKRITTAATITALPSLLPSTKQQNVLNPRIWSCCGRDHSP